MDDYLECALDALYDALEDLQLAEQWELRERVQGIIDAIEQMLP